MLDMRIMLNSQPQAIASTNIRTWLAPSRQDRTSEKGQIRKKASKVSELSLLIHSRGAGRRQREQGARERHAAVELPPAAPPSHLEINVQVDRQQQHGQQGQHGHEASDHRAALRDQIAAQIAVKVRS